MIPTLLLLVFLAGIAVSFTPCVLPMVPITMGMIGARSAGNKLGALSLTAAYVLGLAIVYNLVHDSLHGQIGLTSRPGLTEFHVELPAGDR